ncbi:hypothetical protein TNCT_325241 [Trichonephila clavata]|uniref:Uncharacterized protein n=1 Tax=Trichonephila clavata TaxID=2740835 RepID=A0A8X6LFV5_TRICU|nr:hypothetical protein TNCT_349281 [Trichonephila clavata]GFR06897.1 hypothetical protein TNCT_126201 [Trichonephila clavata]GFR18084.1 hypothetical protein TNCT_325241 [Trichonephila clavata]
MHDFPRASEGFSGSSDTRRAPAQFVLRQPHRLIPAGGWRIVRSANAQLPRASEDRFGSSDLRRAPAEFVLR